MKLGFIGLGIMGKPMVRNLVKNGHEVVVYDICEKNIDAVAGPSVERGASSKDVAKRCRIIITMLPDSPQVKEVVVGPDGLLDGATEGSIWIDMSSINPATSKELAVACALHDVAALDAPVSGGEPKAVDGTLSIMVGGDKQVFDEVLPVLLNMGSSAVLCGPSGAGNTTKLANQVIVAVNIAAVSEAFTLVRKAGIDPEVVFNAIKGGLAGSTVMQAKAPMMIAGEFMPGFKVDLHIKDLDNALSSAHEAGAPLPLSALVREMFSTLHSDGYGQEDHSALFRYYNKLSG